MTRCTALLCVMLLSFATVHAAQAPKIQRVGDAWRLIVDGKPALLLGGEMHNSTASTHYSLELAMATLKAMGLNTVLVPITWEQLEPQERQYDFTQADDVVDQLAKHGMYGVVLWFGTWKNGESSYAPLWVKQDTKRFFRVLDVNGKNTTIISPLCDEACKADARAFAVLMKRIRDRDTEGRVVAVQVENEVGAFTDIDRSAAALKSFARSAEYMDYGDSDEAKHLFMGRVYAQYLERVTRAGKAACNLPMFANCWLPKTNAKLGDYPNGGPVPDLIEVWKKYAPSIDWLSPDIYGKTFRTHCADFDRSDNLVFIPETWARPEHLWYAYAEHNAQCVAPFAIEDAYNDSLFVGSIKVLHELLPVISEAQGSGRMHGFMREGDEDGAEFDIGDYHFEVKYLKQLKKHFGLVIQTAPDEFLFSGMGARVFISNRDSTLMTRFTEVRDVIRDGDHWFTTCLINGDQTRHNGCINLRGRTANEPFGDIPAPLTNISYSRITWPENVSRFILPGIITAKIFTIESSPQR